MRRPVSIVYFTVVAVALYLVSDRLLEMIERKAGNRLEHRSLVFFVILLSLALITFSLIQQQTGDT